MATSLREVLGYSSDLAEFFRHLSGQHDQKTHGRKGGFGGTFSADAMSEDERAAFASTRDELLEKYPAVGDTIAHWSDGHDDLGRAEIVKSLEAELHRVDAQVKAGAFGPEDQFGTQIGKGLVVVDPRAHIRKAIEDAKSGGDPWVAYDVAHGKQIAGLHSTLPNGDSVILVRPGQRLTDGFTFAPSGKPLSDIELTVVHEFGHAYEFGLRSKYGDRTPWSSGTDGALAGFNTYGDLVSRTAHNLPRVSTYAGTNQTERFAEAFSAHHYDPGFASVEFGRLDEWAKRAESWPRWADRGPTTHPDKLPFLQALSDAGEGGAYFKP